MSGICGLVSDKESDVAEKMLGIMHHRGPDGKATHMVKRNGRIFAMGHCKPDSRSTAQPFVGRAMIVHDGEIYNSERLKEEFCLSCPNESYAEIILGLFEHFYDRDAMPALKKTLSLLDGSYALALQIEDELFCARDDLGLRPLFFAEGPFPAFASERKALWTCGFKDVKSVEPGYILELCKMERDIFSFLHESRIEKDYEGSVLHLEEILKEAVEKRIKNLEGIGILFSGGLDSTLLACLAVCPSLHVCGTKDSSDISYAQRAADWLGLRLYKILIDENAIEKILCDVMYFCESKKPLDIAIALPLFLAAKEASRHFRVLLSGSGADELFGGYAKYIDSPNRMFDDIKSMARNNLERDDMAAMAHGVELRHPYLDRDVVKFALGLPHDFLLGKRRKRILVDVAGRAGVPSFVCEREKKAMQYGSGVSPILKRIASRNISKSEAKGMGFAGPLEAYLDHVWEEGVLPRFCQR